MPTVVGVERASAERLLLAADLVATVTVARHDEVAAGMVSAVDPAPGARLLRGSTVRLTVSSGRPQVPDVAAGTPVADAERAVRDAGLTPARSGSAREYSATAPVGTVVRTDPAAGTALPGGGRVTLVVSRGAEPPRQVRVPFLVGRTAADATAALAAAGLQAEIENGFPFGGRPADEAQVVSQSHGPGSMVDRGHDDHPARFLIPAPGPSGVSRAASPRRGTPAPGSAGCSAAGRRPSRSGPPGRGRRCPGRRRGTR